MIFDIESFFAPLGVSAFFNRYYEKQPLFLKAEGSSRHGLLSHEELLDALARSDAPKGEVLVFPEHLGVSAEELWSRRELLTRYVQCGHPIVWNRARGVSPAIDAMTGLLANAFQAHVWPNVYATGMAGTPFDMHFDAHEVITIQCEGEKEWTISDVRIDRPLDVDEMDAAISFALRHRRDEAEKRTWGTFTAHPGDLVYIPRGQFHNAKASSGRSLHVTFGIRLPTGFDLAKRIVHELLADSAMREYLPPAIVDANGDKTDAAYAELAERIERATSAPMTKRIADELRASWVKKSSGQ